MVTPASVNDNPTGPGGGFASIAMSTAGMIAISSAITWLLPGAPGSLIVTPVVIAVALLVVSTVGASLAELSVDRRWGKSPQAERSSIGALYQHLQQAWVFAAIVQLVIMSTALVAAPEGVADWLWRSWSLLLVGGGVALLFVRLVDLLIYLLKHERD